MKVFEHPWKKVWKHRDIKLIRNKARRNYLVSESNYHATKFFLEKLLAKQIKRTQIFMNKPVYLGLSISKISK